MISHRQTLRHSLHFRQAADCEGTPRTHKASERRIQQPDLAALYAAAGAVAYPSRYEGFGLPVLEALACEIR